MNIDKNITRFELELDKVQRPGMEIGRASCRERV